MKKTILILSAMICTIGVSAQITPSHATDALARVPSMTQPYENFIQVTGRADKEVVPDEIYIRIVLNENNTKGKITVEKQERDMVNILKKMGLDTDKTLSVDDMSSNFKEYWLKKNQALTTKSYQLKLPDAVTVSKVVAALEAAGISNTDVVRVAHSKIKELQAQTRIEAVKNAQELAQTLAQAVGQSAGRAVFIGDYNNEGIVSSRVMYSAKAGAANYEDAGMSMPNIEFKTIKISYSIQAKFELK